MGDGKENMIVLPQDLKNAGQITGELLPCPFCGCEEVLTCGRKNEKSGNIVYEAFCTNFYECGAKMFVCIGGEETAEQARKEVVAQWNTRTAPSTARR